ncbi:MAG: helix-hairpin-helix domain-containing protein [Chloroflexota bacterium]|nr:helix-hairpin-helix domain-containing protein [Chloroflexota bacterium]
METPPEIKNSDLRSKASDVIVDRTTMRKSLSVLTSVGADLSVALDRCNEENEALRELVLALPPEIVEAAKAGTDFPDYAALRAQVEQAEAERAAIELMLSEREHKVHDLEIQAADLGEAETKAETEAETLSGQVNHLQADLEAAVSEKNQVLEQLDAREAKLVEINSRLDSLNEQLREIVADETLEPEQITEDDVEDTRSAEPVSDEAEAPAELAGVTVLAATVSEAVSRCQEKVVELENASAQIEATQTDVATLQTQLDATLLEKEQIQLQLDEREAELDALNSQFDSFEQQLRAVLPEDAFVVEDEAEEPAAEEGEVEEIITEGDGEEMDEVEPSPPSKTTAVAAGLAAALAANQKSIDELEAGLQEKDAAVADLQAQLDDLLLEKSAVKTQLDEREAELGDLDEAKQQIADQSDQLQALTARTAELEGNLQEKEAGEVDLQSQLDSALSEKAQLEAELDEREAELNDLGNQIDSFQEELQAILPEDAFPAEDEVGEEAETAAPSRTAVLATGTTAALAANQKRSSELAEASAQVTSLSEQLDSLTIELALLQDSIQEKDAAMADLQAQLDGYTAEKTELETQLADQKAGAEAALQEKQDAIAELQSQLDSAVEEKAELQAQLGEQSAELDKLNAEIDSLEESLQTIIPEDALAEAEDSDLPKTVLLSTGIAAALASNKKQSDELNEATTQLASLQEQLDGLTAEKVGTEESLAECTGDVERLTAELTEFQTKAIESEPYERAASVAASLADLPPVKTSAASAALVAGLDPLFTGKLQQLTLVQNIGTKRQQLLYNAGVGTFWELAHVPDQELAAILQLSDTQAEQFDFTAIRFSADQLARETDTVGHIWEGRRVDDFDAISGIGDKFEQRLYEAGICTFEHLANATEEQLAEIVRAPKMQHPDFGEWIAEAAVLAEASEVDVELLRAAEIVEIEITIDDEIVSVEVEPVATIIEIDVEDDENSEDDDIKS